ncbi:MAG: hypothetical protein M1436_01360, partial [Acidobacteria bacterium]|nr:hypothetical protein [Acidobacteriota bacterium]
MKTLLADLRFAFRMFSKTPGFVAVAVLTIAIGVGATTSMFSVIYNVFIDPYPYRDPDRIVFFRSIDSEGHSLFATATFDKIRELRKRATTLEDVAFARQKTMVL